MLSQVCIGALRASLSSRHHLSASSPTRLALRSLRPCVVQHRSLYSRSGSLGHATIHETQSKEPIKLPFRPNLRSYASAAGAGVQPPRDIAILGGGLTGLTTAYYLTRFHPGAKITIYETAERLGGWLDTERIDVKTREGEHATISFERGARAVAPQSSMARWEDFVFFDLV